MEVYTGVKLHCQCVGESYEYDERLSLLNHWSYLLSELGLTPLHTKGASGNLSCRSDAKMFLITKSGMVPEEGLDISNFALVKMYDHQQGSLVYVGKYKPSSESGLHGLIYEQYPDINWIMHGHSSLMLKYGEQLALPVTETYYDYGTSELAASVLQVLNEKVRFVILKDHGFVAMGETAEAAGKRILDQYSMLINILGGCPRM